MLLYLDEISRLDALTLSEMLPWWHKEQEDLLVMMVFM